MGPGIRVRIRQTRRGRLARQEIPDQVGRGERPKRRARLAQNGMPATVQAVAVVEQAMAAVLTPEETAVSMALPAAGHREAAIIQIPVVLDVKAFWW